MEDLVKRIDQLKIKYETLKKEIARKIVGQEEIIDKILVAIFSNGPVSYTHLVWGKNR